MKFFKKFLAVVDASQAGEIARRYFVINSFDGVMTILGILFGFYFMNALEPRIVLGAGMGAGVAICISGISGAYLSEKGERLRDIKELEKAMLIRLRETRVGETLKHAPFFIALVDGISPLIAIIIILVPFVLALSGILSVFNAFYASVALCALTLFGLGMVIGRLSKENMFIFGIKTLGTGIITALILYLLRLL